MKRIQIFLTEAQLEKLRKLKERTGLAVADHIRRAIDAYLRSRHTAGETRKEK